MPNIVVGGFFKRVSSKVLLYWIMIMPKLCLMYMNSNVNLHCSC